MFWNYHFMLSKTSYKEWFTKTKQKLHNTNVDKLQETLWELVYNVER